MYGKWKPEHLTHNVIGPPGWYASRTQRLLDDHGMPILVGNQIGHNCSSEEECQQWCDQMNAGKRESDELVAHARG